MESVPLQKSAFININLNNGFPMSCIKLNHKIKSALSLFLWIAGLLVIGFIQGRITQSSLDTWYIDLIRSPLTPESYVFRIVWTILYILIGISGWKIWQQNIESREVSRVKIFFLTNVILNFLWTPIFFYYHLTGGAAIIILLMILTLIPILFYAYQRQFIILLCLTPYLLWIILALHLNLFIWINN